MAPAPEAPAPEAPAPEAPAPDPHADPLIVAGGDVSGDWCGVVQVTAPVTIPADATLTICAGSQIEFAADDANGIAVVGTLRVEGTAGAPVVLSGAGAWRGLRVGGVLEAAHFEVHGASTGVEGLAGGQIALDDGLIADCATPLASVVGARVRRTRMIRGGSLRLTGGLLDMTDSIIDLEHPTRAPDCTRINGGGVRLSHVRFTGCHCPLHFDAAPDGIEVSDSVFDGATYPVMIARADGTFRRNHFAGTTDHFLDIGGNFSADIADNWFQGAAPRLSSGDLAQFTGADAWVAEPFADVGPRDLD